MKFRIGNTGLFLSLVLLLPFSVFGIVHWMERSVQALPVLISSEHRIDVFRLTSQKGRTVTLKDWENKIVVANFFFTSCPVVCPKMTAGLEKVGEATRAHDNVLIASFSVDPERDSAARLQQFALRNGLDESNWILLTGAKKEIYRLARQSFKVIATDGDGGPQDFIHSEQLILIDKQKRIRGYYEGTVAEDINQLILDIKKLEHE